jgi:hypothetical protein
VLVVWLLWVREVARRKARSHGKADQGLPSARRPATTSARPGSIVGWFLRRTLLYLLALFLDSRANGLNWKLPTCALVPRLMWVYLERLFIAAVVAEGSLSGSTATRCEADQCARP